MKRKYKTGDIFISDFLGTMLIVCDSTHEYLVSWGTVDICFPLDEEIIDIYWTKIGEL